MFSSRFFKLAFAVLVSTPLVLQADDWPHWRGPNHDGHSAETGLLKSWPDEGPALKWMTKGLGGGYSAPAVVKGKIYGMGYRGDDEVAWAYDAASGKEVWSVKLGPANREIDYSEGPRATPAVDGDRLYVLGLGGNLVCLSTDGKISWQKDLNKDLGGEMMSEWGYSESPLVDGDKVVCMPGGGQGTVAALDKTTGKVLWRSADLKDTAAYTSLVPVELGGKRQYVALTGETLAGVEAASGKILWKAERAGRTAVVPTPVVKDGEIWASSGYGVGSHMFEVKVDGGKFSAEEAYASRSLKNDHGGAIRIGDHVYAASGPAFVCMEMKTGKIAWKARSVGNGSLTYADGHLYLRGERGPIALIEPNPEKYIEKSRFDQPDRSEAKSWAHPVISDGVLYLRDQNLLLAYDIKAK